MKLSEVCTKCWKEKFVRGPEYPETPNWCAKCWKDLRNQFPTVCCRMNDGRDGGEGKP